MKDGHYSHTWLSYSAREYAHCSSGWWFGTWILFSHILEIIIPIDFHIFQMGRSTTNQSLLMSYDSSVPRSRRSNPLRCVRTSLRLSLASWRTSKNTSQTEHHFLGLVRTWEIYGDFRRQTLKEHDDKTVDFGMFYFFLTEIHLWLTEDVKTNGNLQHRCVWSFLERIPIRTISLKPFQKSI